MKRPITTNSGNNGRTSLTRNSTIINNNSSGSIMNTSTTTNFTTTSNSGTNNSSGTIYYANNSNNNNQNNRNTMNGNGTTYARPTFGNPVPPMINTSNQQGNSNNGTSSASTFVPPVFHRPNPAPSNASSSTRPTGTATTLNVERQQFIPPKNQQFQRPQYSTPTNTQKRINNIPHSGLSTPKSGKKQPLHLVSCLSPPSTQFSTPNRSTQTPTTPVQTTSKPNPSSSSTNTSTLFPFTSNSNNSFISNNNNSFNKPPQTTSHARFVIPNNYKPQEQVSRLQSSTNLSDSQKENEEIEKLKAEIELLRGNLNKKKLENEELVSAKKEIEEQLLAVQSKMEENQQENSGMLDEDDDFLLAVLDDIDDEKTKDDKSTEEASQNSQKKETETEVPTEEKIDKTDEKIIPLIPETAPKKISKKRVKWKNKNIADLQKDPDLHKALYKLLVYKGNSDINPMDPMDTDELINEPLSGKLWKAHRTISNDQSKMYSLLPILNSYLKQAKEEQDIELFTCTLETILKLVLESEMFRIAFIESFSESITELKRKKTIQENGYAQHPLFSSTTIIIPDGKKSSVKGKLREKRKYLHNYLNDVAYQPDYIFDSNMDSILFNPEEVPLIRNEVSETDLLSDLLGYFAGLPDYFNQRQVDILCTILDIVKTLAIWSPESALAKFNSLIENSLMKQPITIKTIFSNNNVELIQKSLEVLTILVKSETIRSSLQSNNILTRVSAFLNVEVGTTEEMLQCRRMILRLFHYLAFLCPDGISLLKEKHNNNNIVFDAMILLLRKELENIALLEDFSNESERIYLIRDIIVLFNHISRLNSPIPYVSPSLRLDYIYAKTTISIIREKSNFKEKFQLDEMK